MMNSLSSVRKGAWSKGEDMLLRECIAKYGEGNWHLVPSRAGIRRCRKSCRLRWLNYLRPDVKRGKFSEDEKDLILKMHRLLGNRWSLIAGRIPGRTANDVKNYWNSHLSKPQRTKKSSETSKKKKNRKKKKAAEGKDHQVPVQHLTVLVRPQAHRIKMKPPHWFRKPVPSSTCSPDQLLEEICDREYRSSSRSTVQPNLPEGELVLPSPRGSELQVDNFAGDRYSDVWNLPAIVEESEEAVLQYWNEMLLDSEEVWNLLDTELITPMS